MPIPFVGHFVKAELFCLWQLGLPDPRSVWDTWVYEKARYLGIYHPRYKLPKDADEADSAHAKEEVNEDEKFSNSLVATCLRYRVPYAFVKEKERLQKSFLQHG